MDLKYRYVFALSLREDLELGLLITVEIKSIRSIGYKTNAL